jgi:hypothetical protein
MKNIDHWFILIGLLYGIFGFAFGICRGINERFEQAHLHAHINLIGWASMTLFTPLPRLPRSGREPVGGGPLVLYNFGAIVFLAGIPLAQTQQTVALAAGGSLLVLLAMLVFLANYFLSAFSQCTAPARSKA